MAIAAPNFAKNAVPTLRGWCHPKTGELLKSQKLSQSDIDAFNGVKIEEEIVIDTTTNGIHDDIEAMTKKGLEAYARKEFGVELDRRSSRKKLLDIVAGMVKR